MHGPNVYFDAYARAHIENAIRSIKDGSPDDALVQLDTALTYAEGNAPSALPGLAEATPPAPSPEGESQ